MATQELIPRKEKLFVSCWLLWSFKKGAKVGPKNICTQNCAKIQLTVQCARIINPRKMIISFTCEDGVIQGCKSHTYSHTCTYIHTNTPLLLSQLQSVGPVPNYHSTTKLHISCPPLLVTKNLYGNISATKSGTGDGLVSRRREFFKAFNIFKRKGNFVSWNSGFLDFWIGEQEQLLEIRWWQNDLIIQRFLDIKEINVFFGIWISGSLVA